jgi:hypothetical protein
MVSRKVFQPGIQVKTMFKGGGNDYEVNAAEKFNR